MREIKFRAWDKKAKRMLEVVSMSGMGMSDGEKWVKGWQITGEWVTDKVWEQGNPDITAYETDQYELNVIDHELMQYTGLKDKKNKEICEGDIVQWEGVHWDGKQNIADKRTSVVEWYEGSEGDGFLCSGFILPANLQEECEVTGNIYENPELIPGDKL